MKFEIVVNEKSDAWKCPFTVHVSDCRDIKREIQMRHAHSFSISGTNAEDAIENQVKDFQDDDMGYNRSYFRIAPCVAKQNIVMKAQEFKIITGQIKA